MAKFMIQARYTADGTRGLLKEGGSGRRAVVKKVVEDLGGKLETFYFAFGDADAVRHLRGARRRVGPGPQHGRQRLRAGPHQDHAAD